MTLRRFNIFVLGTAAITTCVVATLRWSPGAATTIDEWFDSEHTERLHYIVIGFLIALAFVFLGGLVNYLLTGSDRTMSKSAEQLQSATDTMNTAVKDTRNCVTFATGELQTGVGSAMLRLNTRVDSSTDKLRTAVDESDGKLSLAADKLTRLLEGPDQVPGLLAAVEGVLRVHKRLNHVDEIVLLDSFDALQQRFMELTAIGRNCDKLTLRIVGTMLGTYGASSLSLAKRLVNLSKGGPPFKMASFSVPGHLKAQPPAKSKEWENDRSLYPFSARVAAGEVLIGLIREWRSNVTRTLNDDLRINIYFQRRVDIFPAVQLWEGQCAMILCSTGTRDRMNTGVEVTTAVTEVMEVAIMLQKEPQIAGIEKCDLSATLDRIKRHIIDDYTGRVDETWTLDRTSGMISVRAYCELYEEDVFLKLAKAMLEDAEYESLATALGKLANCEKGLPVDDFEDIITVLANSTETIARGTGGSGETSE